MLERYIDKKIRILEELLTLPANEKQDAKGTLNPCRYFATDPIQNPYPLVSRVLKESGLIIASDNRTEQLFFNGVDTGNYLLEVRMGKADATRLSITLKEDHGKSPKRKRPLLREKTLELIARKIGEVDNIDNLIRFLRSCGTDEELIIPQTKWRMIFDVLIYLSYSEKKEDGETLSKIIGEATHPLMHKGDAELAQSLRNDFDMYLHYDNFGIAYKKEDGTYWALPNMAEDEIEIQASNEADDQIGQLKEDSEKQLQFLLRPENRERISLLRKAYPILTNIVSVFCENPLHPTVELNQDFLSLNRLINFTFSDLKLKRDDFSPFSRTRHFSYLPFDSLFSAEQYYREQGDFVDWEKIRPSMNAMYGDIEDIYQEINGSDVLAEPDKQDALNQIQLRLSVLKKEAAKKASQAALNTTHTHRTFTHLPLQVELVGKSAITITKEVRKSIPKTKDSQTFAGPLVVTHKIGGLGCYSDGIIRFNEKEIPMRVQLRDICVLFICNPNQLVTSDDIYDVLEKAIPKITIAKYVSELHTILQESVGRPVIKNLKNTGWKLNLTD